MDKFLTSCGIKSLNPGAYVGATWQSELNLKMCFPSLNPNNKTNLADVSGCSAEDYEIILNRSCEAFIQWRNTPAPIRGALIRQIGNALRQKKHILGELIALEMGKSRQEADGEVQEMIDMADFCVGQSRMLYGKTMHSERPFHRMYEQWHPLGIVAVITAFNFPMAVWAWNAFINAICGNITIWKPSSKTPLCAIAVHQLCAQILKENQAPDIFSLMIPQSHQTAELLLDDSRIPLVSFTGSTAVGKKVAARVAARLGQTILELGGNNAIILDETANLSLAIPAIVFSAVGTSGQRCTTTRRLFVHNKYFESVVHALKHAYQQIKIGDPRDTAYHMGPLIDDLAVQQYKQTLQHIVLEGGQIIYGGKVIQGDGYFVEPTLIAGLSPEASIVQKETFAPILYLFPYEHFKDALAYHNAVPQGLSSALFTECLQHAETFLSVTGSDCGIANINIGTSGAEIGGAFGGEKETGRGRESGSDVWKLYMRRQTNTINWGKDLPLAQGIQFTVHLQDEISE